MLQKSTSKVLKYFWNEIWPIYLILRVSITLIPLSTRLREKLDFHRSFAGMMDSGDTEVYLV